MPASEYTTVHATAGDYEFVVNCRNLAVVGGITVSDDGSAIGGERYVIVEQSKKHNDGSVLRLGPCRYADKADTEAQQLYFQITSCDSYFPIRLLF